MRTACPFLALQLLIFLFTAGAGEIHPSNPRFAHYHLPNGLQVFLEERDKSPLINICVAVKAGSGDENRATNGVAHLLEHLVFAGTEARDK